MLTPMIFLGFTILICLASINHNLIEKFLVFCFLICIEPRCWQAQPRGRVSVRLLSDMFRTHWKKVKQMTLVSGLLLSDMCWIKVNYIKNVLRFLAVCFLIYIEPSHNYMLHGLMFLTFYFLIYIEPADLSIISSALFLTFYFLIYIEPEAEEIVSKRLFLTVCFLINTNIPSLS